MKQELTIDTEDLVQVARITEKKTGKIFIISRVNGYQVTVAQACNTAVDCTCKHRHYGRKTGRACKHMKALTAALKGSVSPAIVPVRVAAQKAPATIAPEVKPVSLSERMKQAEAVPLTRNRAFSILRRSA